MGHHHLFRRLRHNSNRLGKRLKHGANVLGKRLNHADKNFNQFARQSDKVLKKVKNGLLKASPIIEGVATGVSVLTGQPEIALGVTAGLEGAKRSIDTSNSALHSITKHKQEIMDNGSKHIDQLNMYKDKFI